MQVTQLCCIFDALLPAFEEEADDIPHLKLVLTKSADDADEVESEPPESGTPPPPLEPGADSQLEQIDKSETGEGDDENPEVRLAKMAKAELIEAAYIQAMYCSLGAALVAEARPKFDEFVKRLAGMMIVEDTEQNPANLRKLIGYSSLINQVFFLYFFIMFIFEVAFSICCFPPWLTLAFKE